MDLMDRIEVLASKHSQIEAEIVAAEHLPQRDDMKIAGLKRTKLRIKDEMRALQDRLAARPRTA